jgi:hypothetical protein
MKPKLRPGTPLSRKTERSVSPLAALYKKRAGAEQGELFAVGEDREQRAGVGGVGRHDPQNFEEEGDAVAVVGGAGAGSYRVVVGEQGDGGALCPSIRGAFDPDDEVLDPGAVSLLGADEGALARGFEAEGAELGDEALAYTIVGGAADRVRGALGSEQVDEAIADALGGELGGRGVGGAGRRRLGGEQAEQARDQRREQHRDDRAR